MAPDKKLKIDALRAGRHIIRVSSQALEDPAVRGRATHISLADYRRMLEVGVLSERTELLEGIVVDKMTKSPIHNYFVGALYELLRAVLPEGCVIMSEKTLSSGDSEVEPDIMVVEGPLSLYREKNPDTARLVVEVSRSSVDFDRAKAAVYASAGAPVYWVVDLEQRKVEVFTLPAGRAYESRVEFSFEQSLSVFEASISLKNL